MSRQSSSNGLGTFAGVFTPSILTILGIILFMRMGYVIGNAGLGLALVIIVLANSISVLTSFSLSAIATNMKVKKGGDYYLISRTLGVEFGGSIGIVLFLAQSVSIAFYCLGFGEIVSAMLPFSVAHLPQFIAAAAVLSLFVLAWIGADIATRFQYLIMAFLIAALASFFIGGIASWDSTLLADNWAPYTGSELRFWFLFALFFPAVTGFTQGVSMSGDLKDPSKSLPRGTFAAVGISIIVYISVTFVFAASIPGQVMATDYTAMKQVARLPLLIDAGVIAATLSSAMASFLGAPRILQSLAGDKIFPLLNLFAAGDGLQSNPRRAVLLSLAIALLTITVGQLDLIAQIVTMFFLISYGLLNYATYFEARSSSPSFRPQFFWYHPYISLAGSVICLAIMLAIDFKTALIALSILLATYQFTKRTAGPARWADGQRSYHLQQARLNLKAAADETEHPRDWRPYILAMSNKSEHRDELLSCASWLEGGSGLTAVVEVITASRMERVKARAVAQRALEKDIASNNSDAYPLVIAVDDKKSGYQALVQSWGIGPMCANTLLLNWQEKRLDSASQKKVPLFDGQMGIAYQFGCNIAIFSANRPLETIEQELEQQSESCIDVWFNGDKTGRLALLFAYLLTRNPLWSKRPIRVLATHYPADNEQNQQRLEEELTNARISAEGMIVAEAESQQLVELSRDAAMVFLPFTIAGNRPKSNLDQPLEAIFQSLPRAIGVCAAEDLNLSAEPEEGNFEKVVAVIEKINAAKKRLERAEKKVEDLRDLAEQDAQTDDNTVVEEHSQQTPEARLDRALRLVIREEAILGRNLREADELGIKDAFE
jgi:amino acid transporter